MGKILACPLKNNSPASFFWFIMVFLRKKSLYKILQKIIACPFKVFVGHFLTFGLKYFCFKKQIKFTKIPNKTPLTVVYYAKARL